MSGIIGGMIRIMPGHGMDHVEKAFKTRKELLESECYSIDYYGARQLSVLRVATQLEIGF